MNDAVAGPRIAASLARLQRPDYDVEPVVADGTGGAWPGDRPGRLILALSRLARFTGREPRQLGALVAAVLAARGARGHLGPVHRGAADEQQLAGHGWLVSGLLDHHRLTGAAASRQAALDIVGGLFLPCAALLADYPRRQPSHAGAGASGRLAGGAGRWLLSSDTYCVFICLEGLVAAYAETRDSAIAAMIRALLELVRRDDLVAAGAQLHASLTAARCLLDFHELTGDPLAARTARAVHRSFRDHARTANDAAWNWFGRPDTWTEPCAMVDALLLALGLWRVTGETGYLDDAVAVEHNGLGYAQKSHGGFGLDTITTPGRPYLANRTPDAAWCCTMRGAVGLVEARERGYRIGPGTTVTAGPWHAGRARLSLPGGELDLVQRTAFPLAGHVRLDVAACTVPGPVTVRLPLPGWADPRATTLRFNGRVRTGDSVREVLRPGDRIDLDFPMTDRPEPLGAGGIRMLRGPLLLGAHQDAAGRLHPVRDAFAAADPAEDPAATRYRVVFTVPVSV